MKIARVLRCASAMALPLGASAESSVTVYGIMDLAMRRVSHDGADSLTSVASGGNDTSRLGFAWRCPAAQSPCAKRLKEAKEAPDFFSQPAREPRATLAKLEIDKPASAQHQCAHAPPHGQWTFSGGRDEQAKAADVQTGSNMGDVRHLAWLHSQRGQGFLWAPCDAMPRMLYEHFLHRVKSDSPPLVCGVQCPESCRFSGSTALRSKDLPGIWHSIHYRRWLQ